jgi:nucleotide-binding universal stress UspA family protein
MWLGHHGRVETREEFLQVVKSECIITSRPAYRHPEAAMYRIILVPLDGSSLAEQAIPLALAVAKRAKGDVRLVRVHEPTAPDSDRASDRTYLEAIASRFWAAASVTTSVTVLAGPIESTLCEYASSIKASLMVLTTHGRGPLSRFWMGSTTDELLRHTCVPLLIHRPTADSPVTMTADFQFHRILVPLDGSDVAEEAIGPAAEMARIMGARLTLLRVVEPMPMVAPDGLVYTPTAIDPSFMDEMITQAQKYVDHVAARCQGEGLTVETRVISNDLPTTAVLEAAAGHDLIALATHGRSRMARLFLGSVADKVVRGAHCPVLVVRHPHMRPGGERQEK